MLHKIGRHPQIVQFFGACVEPQRLALVLRWAPNGTAETALILQKRWSDPNSVNHQRKVFQIMTDVAAAMAFIHSEDPPVIHRSVGVACPRSFSSEVWCFMHAFGVQ